MKNQKKKIILAYSGGLDTSIIITWLKENYDCEVITYTANLGQFKDNNELEKIKQKALRSGATEAIVEDVQSEFVEKYLWPLVKSSAKYEGTYLLGTISRYLIGKKLVEMAHKFNADEVCHGATGKGNDQVRFELSIMSLDPKLKIIAPWIIWDIKSREEAIDYAKKHNIEILATKAKPFSTDENIWYTSHEGGILEDCKNDAPDDIYEFTQHPKFANNQQEDVKISFEKGIPIAINDKKLDSVSLLQTLNIIGKNNGIGCLDIVENRIVGMKSRGVYEFPGGEILFQAHKMLESIVLDRETLHYKNKLALDYADLIYDGKWFLNFKNHLDAFINSTQVKVTGDIIVRLYKGNIFPVSIYSKYSLYNADLAGFTMDESYDQKDAEGFIKIFGLPLKISGLINKKYEE
jgi:argininosuccinate synthase